MYLFYICDHEIHETMCFFLIICHKSSHDPFLPLTPASRYGLIGIDEFSDPFTLRDAGADPWGTRGQRLKRLEGTQWYFLEYNIELNPFGNLIWTSDIELD